MQRRKAKVTSHKALLRMPKHPLNSSSSAGRVRPEQLHSLDFPKEGFNNATLRKKMTAGDLYSATLEQEEAQSTLLVTPGTAASLCFSTGRQAWRVLLGFSPLKKRIRTNLNI